MMTRVVSNDVNIFTDLIFPTFVKSQYNYEFEVGLMKPSICQESAIDIQLPL